MVPESEFLTYNVCVYFLRLFLLTGVLAVVAVVIGLVVAFCLL